jgi:hypothetical protein
MRPIILSSVASPAVQHFSTLCHKGTIFRKKKVSEHTECFYFLYTCTKHFSFYENWGRYDFKKWVFMYSTRYSCQVLIQLEISAQIFEKYWNMTFYENQSIGSWVVTVMGKDVRAHRQTKRHDEADGRFSQFCERAYKRRARLKGGGIKQQRRF